MLTMVFNDRRSHECKPSLWLLVVDANNPLSLHSLQLSEVTL
jgi:hypothetical protein